MKSCDYTVFTAPILDFPYPAKSLVLGHPRTLQHRFRVPSKLTNSIGISNIYVIFEITIKIAKNRGKMILALRKTSSDEEKRRYRDSEWSICKKS